MKTLGSRLVVLLAVVVMVLAGCETDAPPVSASPSTSGPVHTGSPTTVGETSGETPPRNVCESDDLPQTVPVGEPGTTGDEIWTFYPDVSDNRVSPLTSASVADETVYVGASDVPGGDQGSLHALTLGGNLKWSFDHGGHTPSTPTVAGATVYVGSEDHNLYAISTQDGGEVWRFRTEGQIRTRPAVIGKTVLVNSQDGLLYSLDSESGELLWSARIAEPVSDLDSYGRLPPSSAVDEEAVYVAVRPDTGRDWALAAYQIGDGSLLWEAPIDRQIFSSPSTTGGMVYLAASTLHAIETKSGAEAWVCASDSSFVSQPFATPTSVYAATSDGIVYAFDARGSVRWRSDTQLRALVAPTVENDILYVASSGGVLLALSTEDGTLLSHYDLEFDVNAKPLAVSSEFVYVVTKNRRLVAIDMFP